MQNDKQLQQTVLEELKWTPTVRSSLIAVAADDGVVTLSGVAQSYWEKRAAEDVAKRINGVKAVADEIKIQLPPDVILSDEKVADLALANLASNVSIPYDKIKVRVDKGWATLTGEVDWNYQKTSAEYGVCRVMGLIGLTNNITVTPHVHEVRAKIAKALELTAPADVKYIAIKVDGGRVTLSGEVENSYERDLVVSAARAVRGVTNVKDHLNITWG